MSVFTTDITTYVTATFTAAATGFNNTNRTAMVALGESFCALVNDENWEDEFDPACEKLIQASSFADISLPKMEMIIFFSGYCINLAIAYYGEGGTGGAKTIRLNSINQSGTGVPSFNVQSPVTGVVVTAEYDSVGNYFVKLTGFTVTSANQVLAQLINGDSRSPAIDVRSITALGNVITIAIKAFAVTYDPTGLAPAALTYTASNDILISATMVISIAPNP